MRAEYAKTAPDDILHWRNLVLFHEYFHGDDGRGLGASHQTDWTALIARHLEEDCAQGRWKEAGSGPAPAERP